MTTEHTTATGEVPVTRHNPHKRRGESSAAFCRRMGWEPGTLLVGDEGYGPTVIRLTALGEARVLAVAVSRNGRPCDRREGLWTLSLRDWRPVAATGERERTAFDDEWVGCCVHCGCPPDVRLGHDDTCAHGCNDVSEQTLAAVAKIVRDMREENQRTMGAGRSEEEIAADLLRRLTDRGFSVTPPAADDFSSQPASSASSPTP